MEVFYVTKVWDLAKVYKVREQTMVIDRGISGYLEFDEVMGQAYHYLLAEDKGQPVGTLRIHLEGADYGKLERVAVIPSYQKKGVGRQLILAAEEWLLKQNYSKIVLTSQLPAIGFYEKAGFAADYERKVETGIPCVYMEKILTKGATLK